MSSVQPPDYDEEPTFSDIAKILLILCVGYFIGAGAVLLVLHGSGR